MFSLFKKGKPVFDPALGDRLGKTILAEARRGKADTLFKDVERLRGMGAWDQRSFYIDLASEHFSDPKEFKVPDTPLGNLFWGEILIRAAWKARGSGTADTVTQDGAQVFFEHLNLAKEYLLRAGAQDPEDPTAFAFLQTIAMGLNLDRNIAQEWFDEAIRRDPANSDAHYRHITLLCEKWHGSHAEMYAFARSVRQRVPESSILNAIIFDAFIEHFVYLRAFEKNESGVRDLLRDEDIRQESIKIYQAALQPKKKIEKVSDYLAHNMATWWFMAINIPEIVREETKKIGDNFTDMPWKMLYQDPAAGYQRARDL